MNRRDLLSFGALATLVGVPKLPKPKDAIALNLRKAGPDPPMWGRKDAPHSLWQDTKGRKWVVNYDPDTGEVAQLTRDCRCVTCHCPIGPAYKGAYNLEDCKAIAVGPYPEQAMCHNCAADVEETIRAGQTAYTCWVCRKPIEPWNRCIFGNGIAFHPLCYEIEEMNDAYGALHAGHPEPLATLRAHRNDHWRDRWAGH